MGPKPEQGRVSQVVGGEEGGLPVSHPHPHGMGYSCQGLAGNLQAHSLKKPLLSLYV